MIAEEFVAKHQKGSDMILVTKEEAARKLIEFARLKVIEALEAAYDCGRFKGWTNSDDENVHKELFVKNIMSRNQIK